MQNGVEYNLNHDLTASIELHHTQFSKTPPPLHWCIGVRVHPYASPPHTKVLKHLRHT